MSKSKTLTLLALSLLVLVGGWAYAQEGKKSPSTLAAEIESLEKEVAGLSGEEKLSKSVEKVDGMKESLDNTASLLEKVRKDEKDLLKLNCINEKMAAIKGFLKVSEQSYGNLKDATVSDDEEAENHHYTLISIAGQKVGNLEEEAQVCAGEVLRYSGDPVVEKTIDPEVASVNPIDTEADRPYDDDYVRERLPELTPFQ